MRVLLLGSGGREHALAWKLAQSPRLTALYTLPGNPGTAQHGENLPGDPTDPAAVLEAARRVQADLVVVGPEAPLAAGVTDALQAAGVAVFGPTRAAAEIESSKAFAKAFMARHGIPTAGYAAFREVEPALRYLRDHWPGVVIKASGLAAGKGAFLPESLEEAEALVRDLLAGRLLGEAGREIVIEERLRGPEVSVLAFTDGQTVLPMPPAQDHKRLLDGDRGPNTGGMGAFAPSPLCPPALLEEVRQRILQPAVDGLRAEGRPFVGVLYAGLMLTGQGPKVLEFNARFGDPETQVLLPLLAGDLLEIMLACVEGRLAEAALQVRWREGAAAVVVLAAPGYPSAYPKGLPILGVEQVPEGAWLFHAGTARDAEGQLRTAGGRVLGATAYGPTLRLALRLAYAAAEAVHFPGKHYRRDIGRAVLLTEEAEESGAYAQAGVRIATGEQTVARMKAAIQKTHGPEVLAGVGAFGGLFDARALQGMRHPVLAATTDGVGTKVTLALTYGRVRGLGEDLVHHCVNDLLAQGARPLFFLDYLAAEHLDAEVAATIVEGMAAACRRLGIALLGGETAEMPGVYAPARWDVAGTLVGVVEREGILPRGIRPGDVLLGLASSGPHTNGYSLIRRIFRPADLNRVYPELGAPLGEVLLTPHREYWSLLRPWLEQKKHPIKGIAHITGGGLAGNLVRVLPPGSGAVLDLGAWPVPPVFELIQRVGQVPREEMFRVFNMGIGLVLVLAPEDVDAVQAALAEPSWVIGEVVADEAGEVRYG